jgi:hypothetical protein
MVASLAAKATHWVRIFQKSLDTQHCKGVAGQHILAGQKKYFKKTLFIVSGTNPDPDKYLISKYKTFESGFQNHSSGRSTGLQSTDGVVHGVGLAGDVLLAVDKAGQAAQVRQVDPRCENLSVSAGHHTEKEKVEGYRTELKTGLWIRIDLMLIGIRIRIQHFS